jgi:multidrug efflux pump subunit AcrA (membrane-fusion protein)
MRLVLIAVILSVGLAGMKTLEGMKQDPPAREAPKVVAAATGVVARVQDVPTTLRGYGTARAHLTTRVSAEVGGRIVATHPRLDVGNVVAAGEVLFRIDPRDFELAVEQTRAELDALAQELAQLDAEESNDRERIGLARENLELARRDFERVERLVAAGGAESAARLDQARSVVMQRSDQLVGLERALALVPTRRGMLEARQRSAAARLGQAETNLERTTARAPYDARIVEKTIEVGQHVMTGQMALVLADDARLEIAVPLDGVEVGRWLDVERDEHDAHWFGKFAPAAVRVVWTEDPDGATFEGRLERIESYDRSTRTFNLVVAVDARNHPANRSTRFPLTDGMFCEVFIPGRVARGVVPVPRSAVDSDSTVLISKEGRIRTRRVDVARFEGEVALVAEGLEDHSVVLTSRPPRLIDGMSVDVRLAESSGALEASRTP